MFVIRRSVSKARIPYHNLVRAVLGRRGPGKNEYLNVSFRCHRLTAVPPAPPSPPIFPQKHPELTNEDFQIRKYFEKNTLTKVCYSDALCYIFSLSHL